MATVLRVLRLLAVVVWVGGLLFFAFVEAPAAFRILGTTRPFAQLIGVSVVTLNRLGHAAGFVFLLSTITLWFRAQPADRRLLLAESALIVGMVAATMYVQSAVLPAMERDRDRAQGDIATLPAESPLRADFDRLHRLSERLEGAALLLGLGVVLLMGSENQRQRPARLP